MSDPRGRPGDPGDPGNEPGGAGGSGGRGGTGQTGERGDTGRTGRTGRAGKRGQAGLGVSMRAVLIGYMILFATVVWSIYRVESTATERVAEALIASIEQCDRVNVVREQFHGFLLEAVQARQSDARVTTGEEHSINLALARGFKARADALVKAAKPRLKSGSPLVDCEQAYPLPEP